jgi:hypothetical protein
MSGGSFLCVGVMPAVVLNCAGFYEITPISDGYRNTFKTYAIYLRVEYILFLFTIR